ncbi:MAG: hypothetical protein DME22_06820 [Verrucomicrobia bacterium]|nr:MAG: hypothetical protein DME22_06820 [Verrucomicrobiota bacterium]PYK00303.1 MAG: hypothetical protein DME23_07580 [Verrucomicrobiota bacterium]
MHGSIQPETPRRASSPVGPDNTPALRDSNTPPARIPDHELICQIGHGAYGEVWLARNVVGTLRAVKVVYRRTFSEAYPFEREFNGIQKYEPISRSHDGLIDILQIGRNDEAGYFYYVMELADAVEMTNDECRNPKEALNLNDEAANSRQQTVRASGFGFPSTFDIRHSDFYSPRTLRHDLKLHGRLSPDECVRIALSLSSALEHLHKNGLVHRDIKPSNIIFVNGASKLADIGLVADVDEARSFVGTVGFIPPEGPGTAQADVYSLGKVLYEMVTGKDRQDFPALPEEFLGSARDSRAGARPERRGDAPNGLKDTHSIATVGPLLTRPTDTLSPRREGRGQGEGSRSMESERRLLGELNQVVLRACESDPQRRYPSAQAMHDDLALLQQGGSVKHRRTAERRWARFKKAALATSLLGLLVATIFSTKQKTPQPLDPLTTGKNEGGYPPTTMRGTRNLEAWNHYKVGWLASYREPVEGTVTAENEFREAIRLDPKFALPYYGLFRVRFGDTWLMTHTKSPDEFRGLAVKMVELDVGLAETHYLVGFIKFWEWNWEDAEREYREAIRMNPDCIPASIGYGFYLSQMGRTRESIEVLKKAGRVDPTNPQIVKMLGHAYFVDRDFTNALACYREASRIDPSFADPYLRAANACLALKDYRTAIDEFETCGVKQGDADPMLTKQKCQELREAFDNSGEEGYWRKRLDQAKATLNPEEEPYAFARIYARLGDAEETFKYLEKAYTRHDELIYLIFDEFWDRWRPHPRFKAMINKVGLADYERRWLQELSAHRVEEPQEKGVRR